MELILVFAMGSLLPCESVFKLHIMQDGKFVSYRSAGSMYDDVSFWWNIEKFHRTTTIPGLEDIQSRLEDESERGFNQMLANKAPANGLTEFCKSCYS